jgi:hypothetical protein
LHHPSC